jgi:hypothetical protein
MFVVRLLQRHRVVIRDEQLIEAASLMAVCMGTAKIGKVSIGRASFTNQPAYAPLASMTPWGSDNSFDL